MGFVEGDATQRREALTSPVPQIGLGRPEVLPVGVGLDADALDRHDVTVDAQQLLDGALRLQVPPLAEVEVADVAVGVEEVERRPVVVVEAVPHLVLVVDHHRVVDAAGIDCTPDEVDPVLERELGRVDADHDQAVGAVGT